MRVAFIVWSLEGFGGSERIVFDVATNLDSGRFRPIIISYRDGPVRGLYEARGIEVCIVSKTGAFDMRGFWRIRQILIGKDVKLVNAHHLGPFLDGFLASIFTRVRIVFTEHSVWQIRDLAWPIRWLLGNFLRWTDGVVAVSRQLADYYRQEMPQISGRVTTITNGIDLQRFQVSGLALTRSQLGLPDSAAVIGIVANIRPEKNHKLLIGAFSRLVSKGGNWRLVVAGADYMEGEIQRLSESHGMGAHVRFLGVRNDVPDLLKLFDVFCLPSRYEGLPLTLLEAMASGVPIVGTNVMGINEVIEDGVNGVLVPPDDEGALADALARMACDRSAREMLISKGLSYVKQNYDLAAKVREHEALFEKIVGVPESSRAS